MSDKQSPFPVNLSIIMVIPASERRTRLCSATEADAGPTEMLPPNRTLDR